MNATYQYLSGIAFWLRCSLNLLRIGKFGLFTGLKVIQPRFVLTIKTKPKILDKMYILGSNMACILLNLLHSTLLIKHLCLIL